MTLSATIRKCRKDKGLTQGDLAQALGWSQQKVSELENAVRPPSLPDLKRLAEELDLDVRDLVLLPTTDAA